MLFICFAVFRVHEYRFHAYILTIIVQSRFLFYSQVKIHCFLLQIQYHASNSHQHILANQN